MNYEDIEYKQFNKFLDEQGTCTILGISFQHSQILFKMDIKAYKKAWRNYEKQQDCPDEGIQFLPTQEYPKRTY